MKTVSYRAEDNIRAYLNFEPKIGARVMIDPSAVVLGAIELGDDVSIWPHCAIRGDMHTIRIGERSNIQDGSVLHITHASDFNPAGWPLIIGNDVTVGHRVTLHGCTLGNFILVGMGAIIMDGAVVEDEVMIAAGTLVTPGKRLQSGYLYAGSPVRQTRPLKDSERKFLRYSAQNYSKLKQTFLTGEAKTA